MASFARLHVFIVASLSHVDRLTETAFSSSWLLTFESQMASLELLSLSRENEGPQSHNPVSWLAAKSGELLRGKWGGLLQMREVLAFRTPFCLFHVPSRDRLSTAIWAVRASILIQIPMQLHPNCRYITCS
jgi:uncharacterized membrane protein (GlpM family)